MDKKYIYEISYPYCCVACLLHIIINTEFDIYMGQNNIANSFGLNVPENYDGPITNITRVIDPNLFGIILKTNSINTFFTKNKIDFKEIYFPISTFEDWTFEEKIQLELKSSHIIIGYDYGALHNHLEPNLIGHVSLITGYNIESKTITIYDPGPDNPGIKEVSSYELFSAIKLKKDGLWCISKTQTDIT